MTIYFQVRPDILKPSWPGRDESECDDNPCALLLWSLTHFLSLATVAVGGVGKVWCGWALSLQVDKAKRFSLKCLWCGCVSTDMYIVEVFLLLPKRPVHAGPEEMGHVTSYVVYIAS